MALLVQSQDQGALNDTAGREAYKALNVVIMIKFIWFLLAHLEPLLELYCFEISILIEQ